MPPEQDQPYPFIPLEDIAAVDTTLAEYIDEWIEAAHTETRTVQSNHEDLTLTDAIDRAVDPMDWYARVGIDTLLPIFELFTRHTGSRNDFDTISHTVILPGTPGSISGAGGQLALLADHLTKAVVKAHIYQRLSPSQPDPDADTETVPVRFIPEHWVEIGRNETAKPAADHENIVFNVPREDATHDDGRLVDSRTRHSDALKEHEAAPDWVTDWTGPFSIIVEPTDTPNDDTDSSTPTGDGDSDAQPAADAETTTGTSVSFSEAARYASHELSDVEIKGLVNATGGGDPEDATEAVANLNQAARRRLIEDGPIAALAANGDPPTPTMTAYALSQIGDQARRGVADRYDIPPQVASDPSELAARMTTDDRYTWATAVADVHQEASSDASPDREWVDRHSVTCAVCGELADERETVPVTTDLERLGPSLLAEAPARAAAVFTAVARSGVTDGDAHQECITALKTNLVDATPTKEL